MAGTRWLRLAVTTIALLATSGVASADTADFALFDGTNPANQPDSGAVCYANNAFTYHVAVANWGGDGEVRITYKDGDIVRFPIRAGASFAFSQGATGKGADKAVRVSNGGSAAQLAGSMSAIGQGRPRCLSCDADSDGDAGCDKLVEN
jgi:hypothetical protein